MTTKKKSAWIPRGTYFKMKAAGQLDWQLDKTIPAPVPRIKKARKTRRVKSRRKSGGFKTVKSKIHKIPKPYIIYIKGEEKEVLYANSAASAQRTAERKYKSSSVLVEEMTEEENK